MPDPISIIVSKAEGIVEPLPDTIIYISGTLPKRNNLASLGPWGEYCDEQAARLELALLAALPGGVYDRLLGRMLERKASYFRIPFEDTTK